MTGDQALHIEQVPVCLGRHVSQFEPWCFNHTAAPMLVLASLAAASLSPAARQIRLSCASYDGFILQKGGSPDRRSNGCASGQEYGNRPRSQAFSLSMGYGRS